MKKLSLSVVVILLLLGTGNAFAQCHPTVDGQFSSGGSVWAVYSLDPSCYSTTDGVTTISSMSCSYNPGFEFGGAYLMNAHRTFTLNSNDTILNPNGWTASSFVEFNNTSGSVYDWIQLAAYVYHPNGSVSSYSLFYWDGTMGSLNGCGQQYGIFSANVGDTVTIQLNGSDPHGATIRASVPRIINQYP
jgi:hypothetical protein